MKPLEKLDAVDLKDRHQKQELYEILKGLTRANKKLSLEEMPFILTKLKNDGYIDYDDTEVKGFIGGNENKPDISKRKYVINFDGNLFAQLGGYVQKEKDKKRERKNLNLVNFCLAVGTALAGVYALVEMIKSLLKLFCH